MSNWYVLTYKSEFVIGSVDIKDIYKELDKICFHKYGGNIYPSTLLRTCYEILTADNKLSSKMDNFIKQEQLR